jgi:hypothetical protein
MTFAERSPLVDEAYRQPITFALVLHALMTLLALLVLDGGTLARTFACASAGFWIGVGLILCRRPFGPSQLDLAYIRFGLAPAFVASMTAVLMMFG